MFFIVVLQSIPDPSAGPPQQVLDLIDDLTLNLGPYTGKLEESCSHSVAFLDMVVFKGLQFERAGVLDVMPAQKSGGRLLNVESSHPPSLHLAWPVAYLRRLWSRSTSLRLYNDAKHTFACRLRAAQLPNDVMAWILKKGTFFRPQFIENRTAARNENESLRGESERVTWLPVKFDSFLAPVLARSLRKFLGDPLNADLIDNAFQEKTSLSLRWAWKLEGKPFGNSLILW